MWHRSNDKAHANGKVRRVRRSHPTKRRDASAIGVWYQAALYSADHKLDGFCPLEVIELFDDDWEDICRRLVEAIGPSGNGLFIPGEVDGEEGYWINDFLKYNDSRAKQAADALAAKIRKELYADPELVDAIKKRDRDRCRYCGCKVRWSDKRSAAGGTFDHVEPIADGGRNTIGNVVVCCRRCNEKKGKRSLEAAGMRKLPAGSMGAPVIDDDRAAEDDLNPEPDPEGSGRVGSGAESGTSSDLGQEPEPDPADPELDETDDQNPDPEEGTQ